MADQGIRLPVKPRKSAWKKRYFLYAMTFTNGQQYIGVTYNEWTRLTQHLSRARKGSAQPVHQAIREHGMPDFAVLCVGPRDYIADLEGKAIMAFRSELNILVGTAHSVESRARVSAATIGRKPWNKDIKRTSEERAAIKAGLDKSEKTIGARQKLTALNKSRTGIPTSPRQKAIASLTHKGKPKSIEQRENMSEAAYRRHERERSQKVLKS